MAQEKRNSGMRQKGVPAGPYKLTPALTKRICAALRLGNYVETAAAFCGISKNTVYEWLRKGEREKEGPYRDFAEAVKQATSAAEIRDVTLISKQAQEDWKAAAWRLERRNPRKWGQRVQVSVQAELDATLDKLQKALPAADFERVLSVLSAEEAAPELE